jgi:hypothetical protein
MRTRPATYGNECPGFGLLPRKFRDWRGFFVRGYTHFPSECRFGTVPFDNSLNTRVGKRLPMSVCQEAPVDRPIPALTIRNPAMKFAALGCLDEQKLESMPAEERDAKLEECLAYEAELRKSGHCPGGGVALECPDRQNATPGWRPGGRVRWSLQRNERGLGRFLVAGGPQHRARHRADVKTSGHAFRRPVRDPAG